MGDRETLANAKRELEELYLGVPDESVNLTFQDLAQLNTQKENKKISTLSPTPTPSSLAKLPSIDFNKSLQASFQYNNTTTSHHNYNHHHRQGHDVSLIRHADERSMVYDDMSHVSGMSVAYGVERGGRQRRPGIPHSNICTLCSNYIYICRHRCLVCGRVYCRQCVSAGMGEMTEGRKCLECLGRRFSQRYIHKAGNVGWCMGYPSVVKQQELKWAEKGPRNRYGGGGNNSMIQGTPPSPTNPPSFVITTPYTPYSPTNHHPMPF